jgi:hypothetical protein
MGVRRYEIHPRRPVVWSGVRGASRPDRPAHPASTDRTSGSAASRSFAQGRRLFGFRLHAAVYAQTGFPLAWPIEKREPPRDAVWSPAPGCGSRSRLRTDLGRVRQGLRPQLDLRRLRAARLSPDHPASQARQDGHADLRAWPLDVRRCRLQAEADQVALSVRRVRAEVSLGKADRANPLIQRRTKRWRDVYRGRAAVEREFGRLKLSTDWHRFACVAVSGSHSTPI